MRLHEAATLVYELHMYMNKSRTNSLGRKRPLGLDVKHSPDAQDMFWPIRDLVMFMYMYKCAYSDESHLGQLT